MPDSDDAFKDFPGHLETSLLLHSLCLIASSSLIRLEGLEKCSIMHGMYTERV